MVAPRFLIRLRRSFTLDSRSLAAFRIALGMLVAADAVLRSRDVSLMFSADGLFPPPLLQTYLDDPCAWSLATLLAAPWWGPCMLAFEAAAGLILAAGCGTRVATIAAWVAVVSILRRTAPATNAGDAWLACLLFWSMFLPLGSVWSWDARSWSRPGRLCSTATGCLVLQIAVVYLAAGLSKWNDGWLSGDAMRHALSVHDHGTAAGEWLLGLVGERIRLLGWGVLALELLGPLLLIVCPGPGARLCLVVLFSLFHLAICLTMTVGLFGYVGLAAWLALVPTEAWDWLHPRPESPPDDGGTGVAAGTGESWIARCGCLAAGGLALVSLVHDVSPWRERPLPWPLRSLISLPCLHQEWAMFGNVQRQEQWVYGRAELADGHVVDLLRGGRTLEAERPTGGFTSLPHHRWHKLFWVLPRPRQRIFAPAIAAALVRDWNGRHPPDRRVLSLELRCARLGRTAADDTLHELLLASWPPRDAAGSGGFDRLLDSIGDGEATTAAAPPPAEAGSPGSQPEPLERPVRSPLD